MEGSGREVEEGVGKGRVGSGRRLNYCGRYRDRVGIGVEGEKVGRKLNFKLDSIGVFFRWFVVFGEGRVRYFLFI